MNVDNLRLMSLNVKASNCLINKLLEEDVKVTLWDYDSFNSSDPDGVHMGFVKDF